MSNHNQKFVNISMKIPLNIGKPNRNGIIMSQEAYDNLINSDMKNLPIIYEEDKETVIGVGNGTVIDDNIVINGYLWKCEPEFMINKATKNGDLLVIDEAILSCISLNMRKKQD